MMVMRQWRVRELLKSVKNLADLKTAINIIMDGGYDVWVSRFDGVEVYSIERGGRECFWVRVDKSEGVMEFFGELGRFHVVKLPRREVVAVG